MWIAKTVPKADGTAKDGKTRRKRPPFTRQKAIFDKAKDGLSQSVLQHTGFQ